MTVYAIDSLKYVVLNMLSRIFHLIVALITGVVSTISGCVLSMLRLLFSRLSPESRLEMAITLLVTFICGVLLGGFIMNHLLDINRARKGVLVSSSSAVLMQSSSTKFQLSVLGDVGSIRWCQATG